MTLRTPTIAIPLIAAVALVSGCGTLNFKVEASIESQIPPTSADPMLRPSRPLRAEEPVSHGAHQPIPPTIRLEIIDQ